LCPWRHVKVVGYNENNIVKSFSTMENNSRNYDFGFLFKKMRLSSQQKLVKFSKIEENR
jgi:hypothetical protein